MEGARVPAEFQKNLLETLKVESIEDFVAFVTAANYETEIAALVEATPGLKEDRLAVARARTACRLGRTTPGDAVTSSDRDSDSGGANRVLR